MTDPDIDAERAARPALGADLIIPVLACALAAYYFGSTVDLVWEAKATGLVVGTVLVVLCVAHFARIGKKIASGSATLGLGELVADDAFNRQRLRLLVLVTLYVATLQWVGTTLGLFLVLIASMWLLGVRSVRALVGVAAITAAVVHLLLITLLNSRLPQGVLQYLFSVGSGGG